MTVTVECPNCRARFNAAEEVVGRKVRCRKCGAIMPVRAAGDRHEDDIFAPDRSADFDGNGGAAAGRGGPADLDLIDPDLLFEKAYQEFEPPRSNALFHFPFSRQIDLYLPFAMVLFGLIWLGNQAFATAAERGLPQWVGMVRMLVYLLVFGMLVLPAMYIAVRVAARKLSFLLPPFTLWRVGAVFFVPFVLATSMWLIEGEGTDLLTGCIVGLLLALPALWLLLRLDADEGPITLAISGTAFAAAMALAAGAVLLFGMLVNMSVDPAGGGTAMAENPLGPGLRWNLPPPEPKQFATTRRAAATQPRANGAKGSPTTQAVTTQPTTAPTAAPAVDPLLELIFGAPTTQAVSPDAPIPPPAKQPLPGAPKEATVHAEEPTEPAEEGRSPLVRDVSMPSLGRFDRIIAPAAPHAWIGLLSTGADGEQVIERWNLKTWLPDGNAAFAGAGAVGTYHLSSDGKYVTRLSNFPVLSVQVYDYEASRLLPPVRLDKKLGTPSQLGFAESDRMAIHWSKGESVSVEVLSVVTGRWSRRISKIGQFRPAPEEYAISADGQLLAAVSRAGNAGVLELHSLGRERVSRQIPIEEVTWDSSVQVSGVALSAERSRASVMIEREGQALLLCWDTATGQLVSQHLYQAGLRTTENRQFQGAPLSFIDEGRAWLVLGTGVYSTATGKLLGTLGIKSPLRQWVSRDVCYLMHRTKDGPALSVLKLDLENVRKAMAKKK